MKYQVYFGITIRIVILFAVGCIMTFLPEYLRDFFGDTPYIKDNDIPFACQGDGFIDQNYVWGTRHYWYFWMMFLLFILSIINVITSIEKLITKYYPTISKYI